MAVETKLAKLAVLTIDPNTIVDKYPVVPSPITVEPICVARYEVLTRVVKFAVDTRLAKFALLTNPPRLGILER